MDEQQFSQLTVRAEELKAKIEDKTITAEELTELLDIVNKMMGDIESDLQAELSE